ncbi:TOPRIM nucleotidyl transferase/hydrolase domain-containing protein [uncultured Methanobrevibacter sp.]|uniref:TOPRIM nucleotidyl transferase/hydrolase domain-containing protein n=1 Tax=uncultured Methanobrevibacter sp. TaxID=253161 RepID=UPI0025F75253|nr:TOPRIM nucleotidyl transferase/hydrolase domain-containing protein [uncultured Methanobrevibacter sp.]
MEEEFLREYIEKEMYLQNPPLKKDNFLKLCYKYDINLSRKELELYEKIGIFEPIFTIKYVKHEFLNDFNYYNFSKKEKEELLRALNENRIFVPNDNKFIESGKFETNEEEYINYYSNFQIELIYDIHIRFKYPRNILLKEDTEAIENYKNHSIKLLRDTYLGDTKWLTFLLSISRLYYPRSHHDFKIFKLNSEDESWYHDRNKFSTVDFLRKYSYNYEHIRHRMNLYLDKFRDLMGIKIYDEEWFLFYEYLNRDYKLKLEKTTGLAYYFFSLALMLKFFLEDYFIETSQEIDYNRYALFNKENKYDLLFYLSNKFKMNYQPSLIIFVEGNSEVKLLNKLFKWYFGYFPEEKGIDIISFDGVTKLISTYEDANKLKELIIKIRKNTHGKNSGLNDDEYDDLSQIIDNLEDLDILVSNWSSFISYNLSKWYIVPFFVSDDEGDVWNFLNSKKIIHFKDKKYDVPEKWYYIWGKSNHYLPFKGKDIELANFSDLEISNVLKELIDDNISVSDITAIRNSENGINQIQNSRFKKDIKQKKVEILMTLADNLIKKYEKTGDSTLFQRPIFGLLDQIDDLNYFKNNPLDKQHKELFDKTLKDILEGNG